MGSIPGVDLCKPFGILVGVWGEGVPIAVIADIARHRRDRKGKTYRTLKHGLAGAQCFGSDFDQGQPKGILSRNVIFNPARNLPVTR
jgi:hypothetical protein